MSYDLYLKPRSGDFSQDRLLEHFQRRAHYVVQGEQALYQNEDTGVYFSFETRAPQAGESEADADGGYPVSFNMNFFRPSFFVMEAQAEVSHVVRTFDFVVLDPQNDGMGEGEFDASRFVSGWKTGNEFGYSAFLRDPSAHGEIAAMPANKLERIWRWNYGLSSLQQELGESVFVPRIMFFKDESAVISAIVWSDGIPTAFPTEVDAAVIYLKELAPRSWFRRKEIIATVRWDSVRPLVERFSRHHGGAMIGDYSTPPRDVVDFLRRLPWRSQQLVGVSADSVLDAELVAKYMA